MLEKKQESIWPSALCSRRPYELRVVAKLGFVICVFLLQAVPTQGADPIEVITLSLNERMEQLSPIEIEWSVKRSSPMGKRGLMDFLGYAEYDSIEFFSERNVIFRWQDDMIYLYEKGTAAELPDRLKEKPRRIPYGREYAFNHEFFYIGDAEKETLAAGLVPTLVVERVNEPLERKPDDRVFPSDYLAAVGFWTPQLFGDLGKSPEHELIRLLNEGAKLKSISTVEYNGTVCEQVEIESDKILNIFKLDPKRGYSVLIREEIDKQQKSPIRIVASSDFRQVSDRGLWMPSRVSIENYVLGNKRATGNSSLFTEEFLLKNVNADEMSLDRFILRYEQPGTIVVDYNLPEARETRKGYRIAADLSDLEGALGKGSRLWLIFLNVAIVVVLVAILVRRKLIKA